MVPILVALGVVVVLVLMAVGIYNGLVRVRNGVQNAWSQIDVQLQRRFDLIPNLIETVKGYMTHERELLENITKARAAVQTSQGGSHADQIEAQSMLGGALGRLMVTVENYPDLKANQNFLALQEELTSTENKISFARQAYNDSVMGYNNKRQAFPAVIFAGMFGFDEEPYWEITDDTHRENPQVSF